MRVLNLFMLLSLCLLGSLFAESLTFEVHFQIEGKGGGADSFVLTDGKLQSTVIEKQFQFAPAAYEMTKRGEVSYLKSVLTSKKHGTVTINAVVAANGCIAGIRVWSKPGIDAIIHPFTGKQKTE